MLRMMRVFIENQKKKKQEEKNNALNELESWMNDTGREFRREACEELSTEAIKLLTKNIKTINDAYWEVIYFISKTSQVKDAIVNPNPQQIDLLNRLNNAAECIKKRIGNSDVYQLPVHFLSSITSKVEELVKQLKKDPVLKAKWEKGGETPADEPAAQPDERATASTSSPFKKRG